MEDQELIKRIESAFPKIAIKSDSRYLNSRNSEANQLLKIISGKRWDEFESKDLVEVSQLSPFISEAGMLVLFPVFGMEALRGNFDFKVALLDFFGTRDKWTIQKMLNGVELDISALIVDIIKRLAADDFEYFDLME